jgi:transposase
MKAYSQDLRERVITHWRSGKTQQWLANTFALSLSTVKRYLARFKATGSVAATQQQRMRPKLTDRDIEVLRTLLDQQPDASLEALTAAYNAQAEHPVSRMTISRTIRRLDWTRKKRR